jgi:HlyD family secretion protein
MARKSGGGFFKWFVLLVLLGGAGYGGWWWYNRKTDEATIEFRTAKPTRGDVTQSVSANGPLSPLKSVTVGSQISGQITNITVDFNSRVVAGQLLAEIDPATYLTKLTEAKANLANAKASLQLATVNYRRSKELFEAKLISQSDYDTADANLQQAQASVEIRESAVATAEVDLSRSKIYAPIGGIIIARAVDVGQTVAASLNSPTLFVIVNDLSKMQIDALVSEADVGNVAEGQSVNFTVDAFPSRTFLGQIRQVRFAAVTNQNVVNYTSIVDVDNSDLKLRPGMTATVNIITDKKSDVLRLAKSALRVKPPEHLLIKTAAPKTNASATNTVTTSNSDELPTPPWRAEGRRPEQGEMQKWMASLTPEQQEKMKQAMQRRGAGGGGGGEGGNRRGGEGGFGGFGGGAPTARPRPEGPQTQTVYVLVKTNSPTGQPIEMAKAVTIKTGTEDATNVEVISGLTETDEIITGITTKTTAAPGAGAVSGAMNPFGGRRPGGGR